MDGRLVLLHGWGANGEDLKPLGDRLARECSKTLDVVYLELLSSIPTNREGASGTACSQPSGMPCPRPLRASRLKFRA